MKIISQTSMTLRYTSALAIVAVLSISSHLILIHVLSVNQNGAAIINTSGRQRMLSQRMASMTLQYEAGSAAAKPDLVAATDEFEANFIALGSGSDSRHIFAQSQRLNDLYHSGPEALEKTEPAYVKLAQTIAAAPPSGPGVAPEVTQLLAQANGPLLGQLNAATLAYLDLRREQLSSALKIQSALLALIILTLGLEVMLIFRPMIKRIVTYMEELKHLSAMDPLTQVHTRRGFLWRCDVELKRVARYSEPACMLLIGIDKLKTPSTGAGLFGGDKVLAAIGPAILRSCRSGDVVGHWDQEHFIVLLPLSNLQQAKIVAETIQQNVAQLNMKFPQSLGPVTVSIGIAEIPHDDQNLNTAVARADGAMFRAMRDGRGQIEIAI